MAHRRAQCTLRRRSGIIGPRAAFEQALKALNWTNGSNLRVDYRWAANDAERIRKLAAEIIFAPDVILTSGSIVVAPMMRATSSIPIVFVQVIDPVGSGFVDSLARPGATSPALRNLNTASPENGWSC